MTIEEQLTEAVQKAVAPLAEQMRIQAEELRQLRRVLPPTFGTKKQAAELLGVCTKTIDRAIERGEIETKRVGARVLVDLARLHLADEDEVGQRRAAGGRR